MTILLTVLAGVIVFVLGQVIQRFVLEPVQEQRRVIGDIAVAYTFLANVGGLPAGVPPETVVFPETPDQASRTLRALGARLRATLFTIPFYRLLERTGCVPPGETLLAASRHLVGWSNSLHGMPRGNHREEIARLLRLPPE